MQLSQLLTALARKDVQGNLEIEITGLACDSRQVKPGDLFVATKGQSADGHDYITEALQRGAVAVEAKDQIIDGGVAGRLTASEGHLQAAFEEGGLFSS